MYKQYTSTHKSHVIVILHPRQSLGQTQGLRQQQTLAPQQVMFLRLLGLNTLELEDEVQRTLEENPALEAVDDMPDPDAEELEGKLPPRESYDEADTFDESAEHLQLSDFRRAEDVPFSGPDELIDNFMASSGRTDPAVRARESADSTIGTSVMEHLESQIAELPLDDRQRAIASHIAGNIDDNGYLCATLRQIADDLAINDGLEVTTAEVNTVFEAMRTLDPREYAPSISAIASCCSSDAANTPTAPPPWPPPARWWPTSSTSSQSAISTACAHLWASPAMSSREPPTWSDRSTPSPAP